MRRHASATGEAQEGSGCLFQLDPLRLPVSIHAADPSADDGSREISVSREGIEFRRMVRGVAMCVKLPYSEFEGVAVRVIAPGGAEPVIFLSLEHHDDELSVLLKASGDSDACATAARRWSRLTGRPILIAGPDGRLQNPAAVSPRKTAPVRRKRHGALRNRRSVVRLRHDRAAKQITKDLHAGEREIIARD